MRPGRVLAIVGPTASGKSALALEVAQRLGAQVVAVDAFTVYTGMDVSTAKPAAEVRARIPHHLIDVLDPRRECTVAWFQAAARNAVRAVLSTGATPLLVGGSGLYFRAVVDPLEFPPTDARVRAEITDRFAGDAAAAHRELARVDPVAAAAMDPGNVRRAVRALEVLALTGRRFSSFRTAWDAHASVYPDLRVVGVARERAELVARIEARVAAMYGGGLVEECRALSALGPLSATARQAIGYAEVLDWLEAGGEPTGLQAARERTAVRTRRYAAAQRRWFAADPRVRWGTPSDLLEVLTG